MERERKILVAILALLVLSSLVAIVDISFKIRQDRRPTFSFSGPQIGPGIGIVRIEGPIETGGRRGSGSQGAEAIVKRLDKLSKDKKIRAIVVRINSPGGTVGATQEIYQKLISIRKKNIPLIATMADVAASGGYYIASACDYLYANQGTITGSIGVISFSPNLKRLFEKLGIDWNVIKSGKYKDIMASWRDLSSAERRLLQRTINSTYRQMIRDIARGRNIDIAELRPYADGRIMNGQEALDAKLIDSLGTFEDAIGFARKQTDLPSDAPVYDVDRSPFEDFFIGLDARLKQFSSFFGSARDVRPQIEYR